MGVPFRLRYVDQADAYGLRMTVQEWMAGKPRAVDFDLGAALPRMGASELRAKLFAAGLRAEADGEAVAVQGAQSCQSIASRSSYVSSSRPALASPLLSRPPCSLRRPASVRRLPQGCYASNSGVRRPDSRATSGQFDGWHAAIAAASRARPIARI